MTVIPLTLPLFSNLRFAPLKFDSPANNSAPGAPNASPTAKAAVAFSILCFPGIDNESSPSTLPNFVIRACAWLGCNEI